MEFVSEQKTVTVKSLFETLWPIVAGENRKKESLLRQIREILDRLAD